MKVEGIFSAIRTTLGGLSMQMKRMDVISENIANAEKSPDDNGNVYQRKVLEPRRQGSGLSRKFGDVLGLRMNRSHHAHMQSSGPGKPGNPQALQEFKVIEQQGEKLIFDPNHPKADENGYVKMPDINMVEEMVDLISASRSYEANVTVMNAAKTMAKRSLEI
jgi:flagellar basal-body rod protein FlgC